MKMLNKKISGLVLCCCLLMSSLYGQMTEQERERLKRFAEEFAIEQAEKQTALEAEAARLDIPLQLVEEGRVMTLRSIINGHPNYVGLLNVVSQQTSSADLVKGNAATGGLDLDGSGVRLGIWEAFEGPDTAMVRTSHVEFGTRATNLEAGDFSDHATHVAGTMVAAGSNDAGAQGFAHNAQLNCYDISNDMPEVAAAALAADPIVASNHSYGIRAGWRFNRETSMWEYTGAAGTTEDWLFGAYSDDTQEWDETAYNATHILIVKSAGNDRGDGPTPLPPGGAELDGGPDGFDCIPPQGNAKNILTVGAANPNPFGNYTDPSDVSITGFSSWGPTDDGRVKPDISANGFNLYSTGRDSDSDYTVKSGTSMAAPSVSGGAGLLYQHWEDVLGGTPRAATMKALLLESADEAGAAEGPDYTFGWGLMNVADAAQLITVEDYEGCSLYYEGSLGDDESYEFIIESSGEYPIKVTLVWHDPAATNTNSGTLNPNASYLVNDLDLRITRNGDTFFPFRMDPANPANPATRGNNFRDNVEQVLILEPEAGTYTVRVTAPATVENGPQAFSLWWLGTDATVDEILVNNETFISGTEVFSADVRVLFANGPAPGTVTVQNNAEVEAYGGNEVRIRRGFTAQAGSYFRAGIKAGGGCGEFTAAMKEDNYPDPSPLPPLQLEEQSDLSTVDKVIPTSTSSLSLRVFPNPASAEAQVQYELAQPTEVSLFVINQFGQEMASLAPQLKQVSGLQQQQFDCSNWPAGIYYAVIQTESGTERQAFVVTR